MADTDPTMMENRCLALLQDRSIAPAKIDVGESLMNDNRDGTQGKASLCK